MFGDPAFLWPRCETRAATFENPTTARSCGGIAAAGRKGSPNRVLAPGEGVVLADVDGPGRLAHLWLTAATLDMTTPPAVLRAQVVEVHYDDLDAPSMSVPVPDFFGSPHGVIAPYSSALTAVTSGPGFSSRIPMPFGGRLRLSYRNAAEVPVILYYQADFLRGPLSDATGYLHATFRRENPTSLTEDFVITEGWSGPGRYLGCTGGVRVLDSDRWWGEGEVKMYFDGERAPTICGTGTEDYLDDAWGVSAFAHPETGAPLVVGRGRDRHQLVGFYRWHLADPVLFGETLRVTVQQIGSALVPADRRREYGELKRTRRAAGHGWVDLPPPMAGFGLFERADDWCATGFVYCAVPQRVTPVDTAAATVDLPPPESPRR